MQTNMRTTASARRAEQNDCESGLSEPVAHQQSLPVPVLSMCFSILRMAPHAPSQPGQGNARARRRSLTTSEDDQGLYVLGYRTSQEAAAGHTDRY